MRAAIAEAREWQNATALLEELFEEVWSRFQQGQVRTRQRFSWEAFQF